MVILITGGLGYIGSYVALKAIQAGYECVILDDLSSSSFGRHNEIEKITGKQIPIFIGDVGEVAKLYEVFSSHPIDIVIHCAGEKSVPESIEKPLRYFDSNVGKGIKLLQMMERFSVYQMIFSSSAAIYSSENAQPLTEKSITTGRTNAYADSKLIFENICRATTDSNHLWKIGLLRYFNPVGAHQTGVLGDAAWNNSSSLFNNVIKTVKGINAQIEVFGNNYDTRDGSCIRDFVHIDDLATAHVSLIKNIGKINGTEAWNIGTGTGTTVLEFLSACEALIERPIPKLFRDKRKGDIASSFCDITKAKRDFKYRPHYSLDDMLRDGLKFHGLI
ncbi:UDP-glucose 4-epimerase GalE [Planktomarina temperata]|nr:UDP-glucose 4-epimerase GalE [Planktomarina temperata]